MFNDNDLKVILGRKGYAVAGEKPLMRTGVAPKPVEPPAVKSVPKPRMNGLETRYVNEVLKIAKHQGKILGFWFEPLRFRIAKNLNYTGDFVVQTPDGWDLHEVKGRKWPAEMVRFKTVTEMEPFSLMFKFYLCQRIAGNWQITRYHGE